MAVLTHIDGSTECRVRLASVWCGVKHHLHVGLDLASSQHMDQNSENISAHDPRRQKDPWAPILHSPRAKNGPARRLLVFPQVTKPAAFTHATAEPKSRLIYGNKDQKEGQRKKEEEKNMPPSLPLPENGDTTLHHLLSRQSINFPTSSSSSKSSDPFQGQLHPAAIFGIVAGVMLFVVVCIYCVFFRLVKRALTNKEYGVLPSIRIAAEGTAQPGTVPGQGQYPPYGFNTSTQPRYDPPPYASAQPGMTARYDPAEVAGNPYYPTTTMTTATEMTGTGIGGGTRPGEHRELPALPDTVELMDNHGRGSSEAGARS